MTVSDAPHAISASASETAVPRRSHPRPGEPARAVAMVLGLTAGLSLILALFVSIAVNSGPNGVRLAVAGPAPAVQQMVAAVTRAGG
ncbi:MAG TPA: hypothetical protein VFC16_13835, partial [Nakamurella sp.]|nr:hypothetical protein [Nakamurella sp.]